MWLSPAFTRDCRQYCRIWKKNIPNKNLREIAYNEALMIVVWLSIFSQSVSLTQYVVTSACLPACLSACRSELAYCLNDQALFCLIHFWGFSGATLGQKTTFEERRPLIEDDLKNKHNLKMKKIIYPSVLGLLRRRSGGHSYFLNKSGFKANILEMLFSMGRIYIKFCEGRTSPFPKFQKKIPIALEWFTV